MRQPLRPVMENWEELGPGNESELSEDLWSVFLLDEEEQLPEPGDFWIEPDEPMSS